MSRPWRSANSRGATMTVCWHPSQPSHKRLPKPATMARWACFQASSVGVRCQLMPARMQWFAPGEKPRGVVAILAGQRYIWAMPKCKTCDDTEWVCESHPERPWDRRNPRGCECGAGAPCRDCNPLHHEHPSQMKIDADEAVRRIVSASRRG